MKTRFRRRHLIIITILSLTLITVLLIREINRYPTVKFTLNHGWHPVFSPNGNMIATINGSGNISIWNGENGSLINSFGELAGAPHTIVFSSDSNHIITGGVTRQIGTNRSNGIVQVWDLASGQEILNLITDAREVVGMDVSPDGHYLITTGIGSTDLWNLIDGTLAEELPQISMHRYAGLVDYSPDGRFIALADRDRGPTATGTVLIWDVENNQAFQRIETPSLVHSVAWSPDSLSIAVGEERGTIRIIDIRSGNELAQLSQQRPVEAIDISPNGQFLITSGEIGSMTIWSTSNWEQIVTFRSHTNFQNPVLYIEAAFSPNGHDVLAVKLDRSHSAIEGWMLPDYLISDLDS